MTRMQRLRDLASLAITAGLMASTLAVSGPAASLVQAAATCTPNENGSTTVFPAINAAKPTWAGQVPDGTASVLSGAGSGGAGCNMTFLGPDGSGAGLTALLNKTVNFAASSRPLKSGAEASGLYSFKIGKDAIVFQVSTDSAMSFISNITANQVQGIYKGTITDWNQLGASSSHPINAVCRNTDSGSRSDLMRLFSIGSDTAVPLLDVGCDVRVDTSADEASLAQVPYNIVYTSLANVGVAGTKELGLTHVSGDAMASGYPLGTNVKPSVATVAAGDYPAPRELFLAVNQFSTLAAGASTTNTNYVKAYDFINFMASQQGQGIVGASGFVTVAPFVPFPYTDANLDGIVAGGDIGVITGKWAQSDPIKGWIRADVDRNGIVAGGDIGLITGKWGSRAPNVAFQTP